MLAPVNTRLDPLLCLMKCLVGVVVGIFAVFMYVEQSYQGTMRSFLWSALAFGSLRTLSTGLAGLLEVEYASRRTWVAALLLALPCAAIGPRFSTSYLENYEKKAWAEVSESRDAVLWQHRYTVRVPERFRRPGWTSLYVVAVCQYSVEQKEYSSLGWYAQQVFDKNRDKYDDKSRHAVKQTIGNIFAKKLGEIREKRLGDGELLGHFEKVTDDIADRPWRSNSFYFLAELQGIDGLAQDFRKEINEVCAPLIINDMERSLNRVYPGDLMRFVASKEAKEDDLVWTVQCSTGPLKPVAWSLVITSSKKKLFTMEWEAPALVAPAKGKTWTEREGMQVMNSLRASARAFLAHLKQRLALVEAVENR